eukprot:gene9263-11355_t
MVGEFSSSDLTTSGFDPYFFLNFRDDPPKINNITMPKTIDLSNREPLIITMQLESNHPISQCAVYIKRPHTTEEWSFTAKCDESSVYSHSLRESVYQIPVLLSDYPGRWEITGIILNTDLSSRSTFFTQEDLKILGVQYYFDNDPQIPDSDGPKLDSSFISTKRLPMAWDTKKIFIEASVSDTVPLSSASIVCGPNSPVFLTTFKSLKTKSLVATSYSIDTSQTNEIKCSIKIINILGKLKHYEIGSIVIYSAYPNDLVNPIINSYQVSENNMVTVHLLDIDSGVSKVTIDSITQLYDVDRMNGTVYDCFFQFPITPFGGSTTIQVFDFNHNSVTQEITLNPIPSPPQTQLLPSANLNSAPLSLNLQEGSSQNVFFQFEDPTCSQNIIFMQMANLFGNRIIEFSTYNDIISKSAKDCKLVIGDQITFPQYKQVNNLDYVFFSINQETLQSNNDYVTPTSIINSDMKFLEYQPIMVTGVKLNKQVIQSGQTITVEASISSNVEIFTVLMDLISETKSVQYNLENTVGTVFSGTWTNTITIPQYLNNGTWFVQLTIGYSYDTLVIPWESIFAKGFDYKLDIISGQDYLPPQLLFMESHFETNKSIMVRAQDALSGVKSVSITLTPNNITRLAGKSYFHCNTEYPTPGNTNPVNLYCIFNDIPSYYFSGDYYIYFTMTDYAGNENYIGPDEFVPLTLDSSITINSPLGGDTTPPVPTQISIYPTTISTFPATINVTVYASDDLSGLSYMDLYLNSSNYILISYRFTSSDLISGDSKNGIYSTTITIDGTQLLDQTIFKASIHIAVDLAGNSGSYSNGFYYGNDANVTINNPSGTQDLTLPVVSGLSTPKVVFDLADPTSLSFESTIKITESSSKLMYIPKYIIQHSTNTKVSPIECKMINQISPLEFQYNCTTPTIVGVYFINIKSVADMNDPRILGYSSVQTKGDRGFFKVDNFVDEISKITINFNENPCSGLKFENENTLSCLITNGTGMNQIRAISNGIPTNVVPYPYLPPTISSTTSTLPAGGPIVIKGNNFGNSTDSSKISVMIGNIPCSVTAVNDNNLACNLQPGGNGVSKNVYVTVNGIASADGTGKYSYGDPPSTPCPSPTCSDNGLCISGTCFCKDNWSGEKCDRFTFPVPHNNSNNEPSIVIQPNTTSGIATSMMVSLIAFKELDPTLEVKRTVYFEKWSYTKSDDQSSDRYLYTTTIDNNQTEFSVLLQVFKTPTNISFAGESDVIPEYGIKYSINITNYQFQSTLNRGQLVIKAQLGTTYADNTFCQSINQTEFGNGSGGDNDLRWVKITQSNYTLYGKFSNRAVIDGKTQIISNLLEGGNQTLGETATSFSFIGINVPHFYKKVEIDPNFSVLVNPNHQDGDESNSLCNKPKKSRKWLIPVVVVAAGIFAIALAVGGFMLYRKRRMEAK